MSGGRPSFFNLEFAFEIYRRIAQGENLRSNVRDETMPCQTTAFNWLLDPEKKEFLKQCEAARNIQAEMMFEELLKIADDGSNNYMTRYCGEDHTQGTRSSTRSTSSDRLHVDTRKWYLSKVLPKKFGEKLDLTSDGEKIAGFNFVRHDNTDH
jgi:hypothetical protein